MQLSEVIFWCSYFVFVVTTKFTLKMITTKHEKKFKLQQHTTKSKTILSIRVIDTPPTPQSAHQKKNPKKYVSATIVKSLAHFDYSFNIYNYSATSLLLTSILFHQASSIHIGKNI
jgi:hypothetical protein